MSTYSGPDALAGANGAGNGIAGQRTVPDNTPHRTAQIAALRDIIAGRRAEDRRRDLLWLERHLDEQVQAPIYWLRLELDEDDPDPATADIIRRLRRIERAAETAIEVLARVLDDEAAP